MNTFEFLWYRTPYQHRCWKKTILAGDFNTAVDLMAQFVASRLDNHEIVVDHMVWEKGDHEPINHSLTTMHNQFKVEYGMKPYPIGSFPQTIPTFS
jgi:hypothetical protein